MQEVTKIRSHEEERYSSFVSHFRDLNVYKEAFALSIDLHKITHSFPKEEKYALTDQMRRSSKSVCANIAEGYGRQQYSKPEFNRFLMLALGSCYETQVWLDYCKELDYIDQLPWEKFNDVCDKIQRMLYKLRDSVSS